MPLGGGNNPIIERVNVKSRIALSILTAAAAIGLSSVPAAAQFTTFVPPKKEAVADTTPTQVAEARADSVQKQTLTDMKVWVDSAARALAVNVDTTRLDSAVADSIAGEVVSDAPSQAPTRAFSEGAPAPDTATIYPLLLMAALGCLGAGVLLLRNGGA